MINIILDTNFLIYCAKNKLDYPEEFLELVNEGFNMVVPIQVVNELTKLKDDIYKKVSGKDKEACRLALKLLEVNKIKQIDIPGTSVDEAIVNLAKQNDKNIVATLDSGMRKQLPRVILINRFKRLMLTK